tara:strand:- start:23 stop:142 length:120 start_codon:yes stop_codon:yes gene_type:complete
MSIGDAAEADSVTPSPPDVVVKLIVGALSLSSSIVTVIR